MTETNEPRNRRFQIWDNDGKVVGSGASPVSIDGLTADTQYPIGTYHATYFGEKAKAPIPAFVTDPLDGASLIITPNLATIEVDGEGQWFTVEVPAGDEDSVTWVLRDETLATMTQDPEDSRRVLIQPLVSGILTIKARTPDGLFGYATVNIAQRAVERVEITSDVEGDFIPSGHYTQFRAKIYPETLSQGVSWSVSPSNLAELMTSDGLVLTIPVFQSGEVTVYAYPTDVPLNTTHGELKFTTGTPAGITSTYGLVNGQRVKFLKDSVFQFYTKQIFDGVWAIDTNQYFTITEGGVITCIEDSPIGQQFPVYCTSASNTNNKITVYVESGRL
jgi:hypothetical protein